MSMLLAEELVLLLMDDETGHCEVPEREASQGVALALVFELSLRRALAVEGDTLALQRTTSTGDPLLDVAAHSVTALTPVAAVEKLSGEGVLEAALARLVSRGVLHDAEVWSPGIHLPRDPHPESTVRARLHEVLAEGRGANDQEAALVALLHHLEIVPAVLPDDDPGITVPRAAEVASRSRPMQDYQGGPKKRRSWFNAVDLLDVVGQGLNIFN